MRDRDDREVTVAEKLRMMGLDADRRARPEREMTAEEVLVFLRNQDGSGRAKK